MANATIWVIAANSSNAKILEAENNNQLREICQLEHPESRMRTSELVSDRQGRGDESFINMRHAKEPHLTPKKLEFITFAKHLLEYIQEAIREGKIKKIYLAASPQFLGILRQEIPHNIEHFIADTFDIDMTEMSIHEIREHLPLVL